MWCNNVLAHWYACCGAPKQTTEPMGEGTWMKARAGPKHYSNLNVWFHITKPCPLGHTSLPIQQSMMWRQKGVWRNGSASDSRSEGWEFESLCPHISFVRHCVANTPPVKLARETKSTLPSNDYARTCLAPLATRRTLYLVFVGFAFRRASRNIKHVHLAVLNTWRRKLNLVLLRTRARNLQLRRPTFQ